MVGQGTRALLLAKPSLPGHILQDLNVGTWDEGVGVRRPLEFVMYLIIALD